MSEKLIITVSKQDALGKTLSSEEICSKAIIAPTDVSNFGYNLSEQLSIIELIQQSLLDSQVDFLKSAE